MMWITRKPPVQLAIHSTATPAHAFGTFSHSLQISAKSDKFATKRCAQPVTAPEGGFARRVALYCNGTIKVDEARDKKVVFGPVFINAQAGIQSLLGNDGATLEAALKKREKSFWRKPWVITACVLLKSVTLVASACALAAAVGASAATYHYNANILVVTLVTLGAAWPFALTLFVGITILWAAKNLHTAQNNRQTLANFSSILKKANLIKKEAEAFLQVETAYQAYETNREQTADLFEKLEKVTCLRQNIKKLTKDIKEIEKTINQKNILLEQLTICAKESHQTDSYTEALKSQQEIDQAWPLYKKILTKKNYLSPSYNEEKFFSSEQEKDEDFLDEFSVMQRVADSHKFKPGYENAIQANKEILALTAEQQKTVNKLQEIILQKENNKKERRDLVKTIRYQPNLATEFKSQRRKAIDCAAIALCRPKGSVDEGETISHFGMPDKWLNQTCEDLFIFERSLNIKAEKTSHSSSAEKPQTKHPLVQAAFDDLMSMVAQLKIMPGDKQPNDFIKLNKIYLKERFPSLFF